MWPRCVHRPHAQILPLAGNLQKDCGREEGAGAPEERGDSLHSRRPPSPQAVPEVQTAEGRSNARRVSHLLRSQLCPGGAAAPPSPRLKPLHTVSVRIISAAGAQPHCAE